MPHIAPGTRVTSSDGHELGVVQEVQAGLFKVEDAEGWTYWLGIEVVADDRRENEVTVDFAASELGNHQREPNRGN